MTEFILAILFLVLPLLAIAIHSAIRLRKDVENDNYEYPQLKNFSDYEDTTRN
jgi:hypothetical protein